MCGASACAPLYLPYGDEGKELLKSSKFPTAATSVSEMAPGNRSNQSMFTARDSPAFTRSSVMDVAATGVCARFRTTYSFTFQYPYAVGFTSVNDVREYFLPANSKFDTYDALRASNAYRRVAHAA